MNVVTFLISATRVSNQKTPNQENIKKKQGGLAEPVTACAASGRHGCCSA
jgi:hypothetical protein